MEKSKQALKPIDAAAGEPMQMREQPGYYPGFSTMRQKAYWDATTRGVVEKRLAAPGPFRFFDPQEAETMLAVVARVVPQEDRVPHRRIPILPGIDERLFTNRIEGYRFEDMPSDQRAYRLAAEAIEVMARTLHGRGFPSLTIFEKETILKSLHDNEPKAAIKLWKQMNLERFWTMLVGDCVAVYYAHPWAWDEIGFGGPAYPRGYMRLEEGEPEPWEVEEQRYAWQPPMDTLSGVEEKHGSGKEHQTTPGQGGSH